MATARSILSSLFPPCPPPSPENHLPPPPHQLLPSGSDLEHHYPHPVLRRRIRWRPGQCSLEQGPRAAAGVAARLPLRVHRLGTAEQVAVGAGVLPEDGACGAANAGEGDLYMRAKFERVSRSRDSEAFYMMNPDGSRVPELSIYVLNDLNIGRPCTQGSSHDQETQRLREKVLALQAIVPSARTNFCHSRIFGNCRGAFQVNRGGSPPCRRVLCKTKRKSSALPGLQLHLSHGVRRQRHPPPKDSPRHHRRRRALRQAVPPPRNLFLEVPAATRCGCKKIWLSGMIMMFLFDYQVQYGSLFFWFSLILIVGEDYIWTFLIVIISNCLLLYEYLEKKYTLWKQIAHGS